jgi:type I restriction enzyme M protein
MGMSTDGSVKGTRFIRRRFGMDKCEYIHDLEPYSRRISTPGQQPCLFETDQSASFIDQYRPLLPLSERAENLFFEAHSHIRDIDGMHADEALDELCKVLYAKLYDEEMKSRDGLYRMQRWLYGSCEETAAMTRAVYEEANEYDIRVFALKIPGYQRSRGVFNTPMRLSSSALAKVVETFQNYSITSSATDVKGRAFQNVLVPSVRAGMGQYFTPYPIVKFMTKIAHPTISDLILDPFCGSAHFLSACLQLVREQNKSDAIDKYWYEFAFGKLHGIEKSDRMVRIAMTDMRLQGDGHSNIRCTDALLAFPNYPDIQPESFDLILTNPPFGSLLGKAAIAQLGQFSLADGRVNTPLEILGLERCIQFLRPGGHLGIVLPDGILANRATSYVRDWLETQAKLRAIISLPIETFSPYGANIKTSILFVRKWRRGEQKGTDYPVFLARVDNVGYDATGRSQNGADLDTIASDIREFLNREGW